MTKRIFPPLLRPFTTIHEGFLFGLLQQATDSHKKSCSCKACKYVALVEENFNHFAYGAEEPMVPDGDLMGRGK